MWAGSPGVPGKIRKHNTIHLQTFEENLSTIPPRGINGSRKPLPRSQQVRRNRVVPNRERQFAERELKHACALFGAVKFEHGFLAGAANSTPIAPRKSVAVSHVPCATKRRGKKGAKLRILTLPLSPKPQSGQNALVGSIGLWLPARVHLDGAAIRSAVEYGIHRLRGGCGSCGGVCRCRPQLVA